MQEIKKGNKTKRNDNKRKIKSNKKTKGDSKKQARKQIEKKLEAAFASFKPVLGPKQFKKRIKKAGKVLSRDLNGAPADKSPKHARPKEVAEQPDQQQ